MPCLETYTTLRIFAADVHPDQITEILGVAPTTTTPRDPTWKYRSRREWNLWQLESKGVLGEGTNLEHICWLLEKLAGKGEALDELRRLGCDIDVVNYFVSDGQGGPQLDTATIAALHQLALPIWWDVYFGEDSEYTDEVKANVGV